MSNEQVIESLGSLFRDDELELVDGADRDVSRTASAYKLRWGATKEEHNSLRNTPTGSKRNTPTGSEINSPRAIKRNKGSNGSLRRISRRVSNVSESCESRTATLKPP